MDPTTVEAMVAAAVRDPLRASHDLIRGSLKAQAGLLDEEMETSSGFIPTRVMASLQHNGVDARDALMKAHTTVVSHFENLLFHPQASGSSSHQYKQG